MILTECVMDLFTVHESYYLAQCISADFAMGKGIAVEFNKRFNTRNNLRQRFPSFAKDITNITGVDTSKYGSCILDGRVLNLVTKMNYWDKPTMDSMFNALSNMKLVCMQNNITRIAMPTIGCGLDGLKWYKVKELIETIFKDTQIEIIVCML